MRAACLVALLATPFVVLEAANGRQNSDAVGKPANSVGVEGLCSRSGKDKDKEPTRTLGTEKPLEPPRFWSDLANDEKLDNRTRGLAIYFLFDRHIKQDVTLGDLADILGKPKWLKEDMIRPVGAISGRPPLLPRPDATMFRMIVFANKDPATNNKESIGIYVNVSNTPDKIEKRDFVSVLMGNKNSKYRDTKLKAWAMDQTWAEINKRISP